MSAILAYGMYSIVRGVEKISIKLGIGEFIVNDGYQCIECHRNPQDTLCSQCKISWLREVGHMDYSDEFERRINIVVGSAALVLGLCMGFFNASAGLWEVGGVVGDVTTLLRSITPLTLTIPDPLRKYYHFLLLFVAFLAFIVVNICLALSFFFLCASPTSSRHWRHFTPRTIAASVALTAGYVYVHLRGVGPQELLHVVAPTLTGIFGLVMPFCMKKSDVEEPVESGKVDGDGKMV